MGKHIHSLSKTWKVYSDMGGPGVRMGKYGWTIVYYVGSSKTGSLEGGQLVFRPRKEKSQFLLVIITVIRRQCL